MSDFFQHGAISTLHRLIDKPLENPDHASLESESTVLVLPCHFSDVNTPALQSIIGRLNQADFLSEVIISMNGMTADQFKRATQFWEDLQLPHAVLWNDSPSLLEGLAKEGISLQPGKGLNIWLAFGWLALNRQWRTIVLHDCDILNYELDLPLTLAFPTRHLGYKFSKGYYSRVNTELFGRVTRLFVLPFIRSLMRVLGHIPLLDFIDSFRYPLAGECSMSLETALNLPIEGGWGLEIGWLCELHRLLEPASICQVDLATLYDHNHQNLEESESRSGLIRMTSEIGSSLLSQLEREGASFDRETLEALLVSYQATSKDFVRRYRNVAILNRLPFNEVQEGRTIDSFHAALKVQCAEYLNGVRSKPLPPWRLVIESGWRPVFTASERVRFG